MFSRRSTRAFTLVEILVCVVILGISAAVIVPNMSDRDDLKVSAASRLVMADLMYAQNRAITTQSKHYIIFDTTSATHSYQLATSVTPLVAITHPLTKESSYVATFGTGGTNGLTDVALTSASFEGKTTIAFDELGVPYYYDPVANTTTALSTTGGSTIKLTSGKFSMTITIEPYTGEIKVN